MNKKIEKVLCVLVCIGAVVAIWPIIKWLAVVLFALLAVAVVKVAIDSKKEKEVIMDDPVAHFAKQKMKQDILEAEYKEREINE